MQTDCYGFPATSEFYQKRALEPFKVKTDGVFVFEHGKDYDFSAHPHFVEHRAYGSVNFSLFR
jgi:hypothetical protein